MTRSADATRWTATTHATSSHKGEKYDDASNETKSMFVKFGRKKDMVKKGVPFFLISAWMGDNLLKPENANNNLNMSWRNGIEIKANAEKIMVKVLYDFSAPMRMRLSGIFKKPMIMYI